MSMNSTFADDTYTFSPTDYVEQGAEVVPYPGHYLIKPLSVGRAKDKEGNEVLRKGEGDSTWPILRINRVQIENEDGTVDKFAVFQDVATKPMQRRGAGSKKVYVSQAQDLLRAIDVDAALEATGFEELYQTTEEKLKQGEPFVAFVGLTARDNAYVKAELAKLGPDATWEEKNPIYNAATKRTKDFRNPDGTYKFQVEGPSGAILNARPTLTGYVASNKRDEVVLGPQQASSK